MSTNENNQAEVTRVVKAPAEAVWAILADGWLYATWVVGASRVRDVDEGWPAAGKRIHHSFGTWPLLIHDTTSVERSTEPSELVLTARGWPFGEARVQVTIEPNGPAECIVTLVEDASAGPGQLVPKPARQLLITPRNTEALRRLAYLAEGRHRSGLTGT